MCRTELNRSNHRFKLFFFSSSWVFSLRHLVWRWSWELADSPERLVRRVDTVDTGFEY